MKIFTTKPAKSILALGFWLGVWGIFAKVVGRELLIPSPLSVWDTLFSLCGEKYFWDSIYRSLLRIFGGYLAGVALGGALAILTAFVPVCDVLFSPVIRVIRATPVASFIILALLWVGYSAVPAVISALMVIPVVWGNVRTGISSVERDFLELAHIYRFNFMKKLNFIYIPTAKPHFFSGCITALGLAWKSGVAAEVLCLPRSAIGTRLYYSKIYLETPSLFAWTAVVVLLSFVLEKGISLAFSHFAIRGEKGAGEA